MLPTYSIQSATKPFFERLELYLVDASNVFDSISNKTFLQKIGIICFPIERYVWNCYNLFGAEIRSTEETSIGNPTAMAIYAIAIILLFLMLVDNRHRGDSSTRTAAYIDDFTATVKCHSTEKLMRCMMCTWSEVCLLPWR